MIEPPLQCDAKSVEWTDEADVVVVGLGGAGITCVLQACEEKLSVIACERFKGGGATAHSGGIIYAGGTRVRVSCGVADNATFMRRYLEAEGSPVKPETMQRFCEGSAEDLAWLEKYEIPYSGPVYPGKAGFPPEGYFLYFSGNEMHPSFAAVSPPAPRGHRPVSQGITGGEVHFSKLFAAALRLGPKLLMHSPVRRLVIDPTGRVIGVEASILPESVWSEHDQLYHRVRNWRFRSGDVAERAIAATKVFEDRFTRRRLLKARRGVLLSTGGFVYNLKMLRQYRPVIAEAYKNILRLGVMGCDGSGIELGQSVGGSVDFMDRLFVGRGLSPPNEQVSGVLVNALGERFANEDTYVSVLGEAISKQPGGIAWLVMSPLQFWKSFRWAFRPGRGLFKQFGAPIVANRLLGGFRRGKTLRRLAAKCGIEPEMLETTVANYNASARASSPDLLGKSSNYVVDLGAGPYYAIDMQLSNPFAGTPVFTLGGLRVNEDTGAVLRDDGSSIQGLYAAGRTAVGLCSAGYVSGMSIADAVFSGRRAARSMASSSV